MDVILNSAAGKMLSQIFFFAVEISDRNVEC